MKQNLKVRIKIINNCVILWKTQSVLSVWLHTEYWPKPAKVHNVAVSLSIFFHLLSITSVHHAEIKKTFLSYHLGTRDKTVEGSRQTKGEDRDLILMKWSVPRTHFGRDERILLSSFLAIFVFVGSILRSDSCYILTIYTYTASG